MNEAQVKELILQALETELGGVQVYKTALQCVVHDELKGEWEKYLDETEDHVEIMRDICDRMDLDAEEETPGRRIVRDFGKALVKAMTDALDAGDKSAAQLVATECVMSAEAKDHQNWELIGEVAKKIKGDIAKALRTAHDKVEKQETEHFYHTQGWARELWIEALGMPAVLPPPEEEKHVTTAIGAARAEQSAEHLR